MAKLTLFPVRLNTIPPAESSRETGSLRSRLATGLLGFRWDFFKFIRSCKDLFGGLHLRIDAGQVLLDGVLNHNIWSDSFLIDRPAIGRVPNSRGDLNC